MGVVISRSEATKQSMSPRVGEVDCFASLAMTVTNKIRHLDRPVAMQ